MKDSNEARLEVLSRALMKEISETIPGAVGPYSPQIDKISDNFLKTIRLNLPRNKKTPAIKARLYGIIRKFEEMGVNVCNAQQSQAVLHLYKCYCKKRKCLNCRVFSALFKKM